MIEGVERERIEIGAFVLNVYERTLRFGGRPVALKPKEIELLIVLARAYPRIVSKDEIVAALWRDGAATDAALTQTVYRLRRALALRDAVFPYVRTVPGLGLCLAKPPTAPLAVADRDAFRSHQRAMFHLVERGERDLLASLELFERALAVDPRYVPSLLGLARASMNAGLRLLIEPIAAGRRAHDALARVERVAGEHADALALLGLVTLFFDDDLARARGLAERAAMIGAPTPSVDAALAWSDAARGRLEAAVAHGERALRARPSSVGLTTMVGQLLYFARRYDEARELFAHAMEFAPSYGPARFYDACAAAMQGELDAALDGLRSLQGRDMSARVHALRGVVHARRGERARAARALGAIDDDAFPSRLSTAAVLLALDEREAAATSIAAAADRGEPMRFVARIDPLYAPRA